MNWMLWCAWLGSGDLLPTKMTALESAALIMLAASILVFRTFRERYLLVWVLGWLAYLVARWPLTRMVPGLPAPAALAITQCMVVLAVSLFAAAAVLYTEARKLLLPLFMFSAVAMSCAGLRALLLPDAQIPFIVVEAMVRAIALGASIQVIRSIWGRWQIGPWLLAFMLPLLRLNWQPVGRRFGTATDLIFDLLLGLSMLMVVLDHYRLRNRRLGVVSAITASIARAQEQGPMLLTAMEELKQMLAARAAWFRFLEGGRLVLSQQVGLSADFVQSIESIELDSILEKAIQSGQPEVVKASAAPAEVRAQLRKEGLRRVIVIPVRGKRSVIGILSVGSRRRRSYPPEELEFLATTAHQLGMAVENVRLREQILRSQRQWVNTFDSIEDLILVHDADFRILKVNHPLLKRLNRAPHEVVGKLCTEILPHQHSQWAGCPYCTARNDSGIESSDPCFGGFSLVSTSSYSEQGRKQNGKGTIHVVRDTTERRSAEEKYRSLFEQVQEGVFAATADGRLLECNNAFVNMLGYSSREELLGVSLDRDLCTSSEQRESLRRELEQHNYVRNFEVTLRKKDGTSLTALESSFATRDAQGRVERYQGFLLDMSEKKRAEDEIRRRNRELNALNAMAVIATQSFDLDEILNLTLRQVISLFAADTGSIYLSDADTNVLRRRAGWGHRSDARARFSEVRLPEGFGDLVMRSRTEVITPEYLPHLPPLVSDFVCADGLRSWIWVVLWGKDRTVGVLGISCREAREFSSNDESLMIAVGRQLATTIEKVRLYEETCRAYEDLRHAQEQLLQSEKMSAVGQLISGVAHELNNPLTAILGYAQLLESEGLSDRAQDYVGKLFKQAQRTHRVVQNLLSFARQRKPQKSPVEIRRVLEDTLALRDYDLKANNIRIEKEIESALPTVTADSHQLEQVFLNIINNAVDAMLEVAQKGILKVRVYSQDGDVWIEFHDQGPGIKDTKRIFDPFYTTKEVGKGTGLGLSICYGIVKEHGGDILAANRPEGGAVIKVRLPAAGRPMAHEDGRPLPRREFILRGRLLLVDDEEAVLEFERDVLTGAGGEVVALTRLEDARTRLLNESFDAVVINGRIPGQATTQEMHGWLRHHCPNLEKKILFTFSHLADQETRTYLEENHLPYMVKPFEVGDLIGSVRKLLQPAAAAAGASS
jgi:two-component system NtrC family sensor kinase